MPAQPRKAITYLALAYSIVTLLGIGTTNLVADQFHSSSLADLGFSVTQGPSYLMILPLHLLLNVLVWPWFAWVYRAGLSHKCNPTWEMVKLGLFWTAITIVIDLIGWVLIPHLRRMTRIDFLVHYQPWLTLVYLAIFLSPLSTTLFVRRDAQVMSSKSKLLPKENTHA